MNLTHIPTLKDLCARAGMRPNTDASQHFLVNERTLAAIVDAVDASSVDVVLEVGAGFGVLTAALAPHTRRIVAVERDPHIVPILEEIVAPFGNVEIIRENILKLFDRSECAALLCGANTWTLATNLPYAITSDFLRALFDSVASGSLPPPQRAVLLLQSEVVDRLIGARGSIGFLTMLTALHCDARRVANVPPTHFWPMPKVRSAVVALTSWRSPEDIAAMLGDVSRDAVLGVMRSAFAHRRQQVRNALRACASDDKVLDRALQGAEVNPSARPDALTLEQWITLARELSESAA